MMKEEKKDKRRIGKIVSAKVLEPKGRIGKIISAKVLKEKEAQGW
ncbi:MAG: hypothetical protein QMD80_00360 [archaeon]|nr:hypothetical protein [archaeon]